jgi:hypothetical protein
MSAIYHILQLWRTAIQNLTEQRPFSAVVSYSAVENIHCLSSFVFARSPPPDAVSHITAVSLLTVCCQSKFHPHLGSQNDLSLTVALRSTLFGRMYATLPAKYNLKQRWHSRYRGEAKGSAIRVSNSGRGKKLFFPKRPYRLWLPTSLLFCGYFVSFLGIKPPGCEVTTNLYLAPRGGQSGFVPLFLPCMPWNSDSLNLFVLHNFDSPKSVLCNFEPFFALDAIELCFNL